MREKEEREKGPGSISRPLPPPLLPAIRVSHATSSSHPSRRSAPAHRAARHNRAACFLSEEDYLACLNWLDDALGQTGCQRHAFVLMTNHVHLLLTPENADAVPGLLISIGRRDIQYFNRTCRRTGTLRDSRYKSSLVQTDSCRLASMCDIELNPDRAAMVDDPAGYRWSS